jgi:hypothetical protein
LKRWIHLWYVWCTVKTHVNDIMYPHLSQQLRKKTQKNTKWGFEEIDSYTRSFFLALRIYIYIYILCMFYPHEWFLSLFSNVFIIM